MTGIILSSAVVALLAIMVNQYSIRIQKTTGHYEEGTDALRSLIKDVRRARRRILVSCEKCQIAVADPALLAELSQALCDAKRRKVQIRLVIEQQPPEFLTDLASEGIITIHRPRERSDFHGRVIDGRLVEQHVDGDLYPRGKFTRLQPTSLVTSTLRLVRISSPS